MKKPYYLFSNGRLRRKHNTLFLERKEYARNPGEALEDTGAPPDAPIAGKHPFPIEHVESLHLFGEIDLNTKLISFLAQHKVPAFCFDYYGNFTATLYPRDFLLSGRLHVRQVQAYLKKSHRLALARTFVDTALHNMLRVLKYYSSRMPTVGLGTGIEWMEAQREGLVAVASIEELMGMEGNCRERYYSLWPLILGESGRAFPFERRSRRPPSNSLNALISFGNSLCYTTVIRQIYRTALDPKLSYLHEPGERRFSLALDLAEVFKPLLVDRAIFRLIKTGSIKPKHFEDRLGGVYLSETGRRIFVEHWDNRLRQTIQHRTLNKKVSYERLIRLECYRLIRHLMDPKNEVYEGFRMWW
ncbi:MAG: type I-B CRISPR-associated endonuclease Cas1b [Bacteroidota bacterium]